MGNSVYIPGRSTIGIPSAQRSVAVPQDAGLVVKVGVLLLCAYVFIIYSRALEIFGIGTVTAILLALLVPCIVLSGNMFRIISDRTGHWLLAYGVWFCLAVALSSWRRGSVDILLHRTGRALLLYVAVVVLVSRKREFMKLIWAIALGNLFLVCRALLYGSLQEGRLVAGRQTFGDPNQLAMYAIFGLFFWWLIGLRLPLILRFVPLVAGVAALLAFGRAGSRGGLIALLVAGVAHFWHSSLATKIRVAVGTVVLLVLALILLPPYLRSRFLTFFSVDSDSEYAAMLEGNDVASTVGRQKLAGQAFQLSLDHPLFGVGPGEFGNAIYKGQTVGETQFISQASHNSYLQISSETGIIGALLFIAALVTCIKQRPKGSASGKSNPPRAGPLLVQVSDRLKSEYSVIVHYSRVTLIFIAAFALSLSFAYDDIFMLAMALMTASVNVANQENPPAALQGSGSVQSVG